MFIKISEKDCKVFNECGISWAGKNSWNEEYNIHKTWIDKCVKSGLVKNYTVTDDVAIIKFHSKTNLFKVYKKTIVNERNRGVIIEYHFATDELYMKGYDGWSLDINSDLYGQYLDEYLSAMNHIRIRKEQIKLWGWK